ncbi:MAG: farnesyl-diphosphate synthase [Opitutus sp.]|nr:farnesyl-diphosphate synthase [Opitutus sp.]
MTRPCSLFAATHERALRAALHRHLPAAAQAEPRLVAALAQGAAHPGKLLRGRLVLAAAHRHGLGARRASKIACAVEYFHTSSLLLDDLPCMDDAVVRRGQPCVHRRHGEATAILAALALINRAYALVGEALVTQPLRVRARAVAWLDRSLGLAGLVGGQAWDLAFARSTRSPALVSRIAAGKTGALFVLAVQLPATLARPSRAEQRALDALCIYWGQLYQIADDLSDVTACTAVSGKTSGRDRQLARPNLAVALGSARAQARLVRLSGQAERALTTLRARGGGRWDYLWELHAALVRLPAAHVEAQHHAA